MDDITEGDIYDWLDSIVEQKETYDPSRHITAKAYAERCGRSISWATRKLAELVKAGKLRQVHVIHGESGRDGVAYVRDG